MYWLKPFDAVNDAANAWSLRQFPWEEPILEIGGGDGVFSFILHGGEFALGDDRYVQADPDRVGDIFDVYCPSSGPCIRRLASLTYDAGVDLKASHLLKGRETRLYRWLVLSAPEPLPFADKSFRTVFLYLPHGLVEAGKRLDYERALVEIRRVLSLGGMLLMIAVNRDVERHFVCHPLHRFLARRRWHRLSEYFRRLDAGRYAEITALGRTRNEWDELLGACGFEVADAWSQVQPTAWRIYDLQTRPILRPLIRLARLLERARVRNPVKAVWVACWLPLLAVFYWVFARPTRSSGARGLFFAFRAVAT